MRGYDRKLRSIIEERFSTAVRAYQAEMNGAVLRILEDVLKKLNCSMPDGVDTSLPSSVPVAAPWDSINVNVPYAALPLQEAINFVSYLIKMQAGKSGFAPGVATVGGRTHVRIITKDKGFVQLNEPELTHNYTGFGNTR
jgi:hypothetical protein